MNFIYDINRIYIYILIELILYGYQQNMKLTTDLPTWCQMLTSVLSKIRKSKMMYLVLVNALHSPRTIYSVYCHFLIHITTVLGHSVPNFQKILRKCFIGTNHISIFVAGTNLQIHYDKL